MSDDYEYTEDCNIDEGDDDIPFDPAVNDSIEDMAEEDEAFPPDN